MAAFTSAPFQHSGPCTTTVRFLLHGNFPLKDPTHSSDNKVVPTQQRLDSYFTVTSPSKIQPTALTIRWSLHNNG